MSWALAGAFPVPALTAVRVLDEALRLQPGRERLLVNGAGGVTGGLVVSLAVLLRMHVLATAGPTSQACRSGGRRDGRRLPRRALAGSDPGRHCGRGSRRRRERGPRLRRDGGRLATITSDPEPQHEFQIASVYVRPDAAQLALARQACRPRTSGIHSERKLHAA
jgi:hypothetical protein